MTPRPRKGPAAETLRAILATNLQSAIDQHPKLKDLGSSTARYKALAALAGTTLSQIQRTLKQEVGTSIDMIEAIALALDIRATDLLTIASDIVPVHRVSLIKSYGRLPPELRTPLRLLIEGLATAQDKQYREWEAMQGELARDRDGTPAKAKP